MPDDLTISIEVPPDPAFASTLTGAAESLAKRAGFAQRESLRFQLAVEEFFLGLAGAADSGLPLRAALTAKRHLLRAGFTFKTASLSLAGLNLTAVAAPGDESGDLGLLLAGKTSDRFRLKLLGQDRFLLEAEVDRTYPDFPEPRAPEPPRPPFTVQTGGTSAQLSQAAALARAAYPAWALPQSFQAPEKFADIVAGGGIACALALDVKGRTVGLLTWSPCSEQALYFSGPFVFAPEEQAATIARLLVDAFLSAVAREQYSIVLNFRPTRHLPPDDFETLGSLRSWENGQEQTRPVVFRHLREDNGLAVWASPLLEEFLRETYDRLALPRDILPVADPAGRPREASLLGAGMDRNRGLGELQVFLDGADLSANLEAHVTALHAKGIRKILYYMDLAQPWEAALAGDLIRAGFAPRLVMPRSGQADKVVWQHERSV